MSIPGELRSEGLGADKSARLHPTATLEGRVVLRQDAVIGQGDSLGGDATVANGCRVGSGATVKRSILLPGSSVGHGAYVEGCVVGHGYDVCPGDQVKGAALVRRSNFCNKQNRKRPAVSSPLLHRL